LLRLLESRIAASPQTLDKIFRLFFDENAPCDPGSLFDYVFVIPDRETRRTDDLVGFTLRDPNEFISAISALYAEKLNVHQEAISR
jgi:hypothetical protein